MFYIMMHRLFPLKPNRLQLFNLFFDQWTPSNFARPETANFLIHNPQGQLVCLLIQIWASGNVTMTVLFLKRFQFLEMSLPDFNGTRAPVKAQLFERRNLMVSQLLFSIVRSILALFDSVEPGIETAKLAALGLGWDVGVPVPLFEGLQKLVFVIPCSIIHGSTTTCRFGLIRSINRLRLAFLPNGSFLGGQTTIDVGLLLGRSVLIFRRRAVVVAVSSRGDISHGYSIRIQV